MTHPASLSSANTKGVKNITRKVIKRLEGLGHLEMVDLTVSEEEEEPEKLSRNGAAEDSEVERLLYALGKEAVKGSQANGMAKQESTKVKPNLEIPRKVLHASIGLFSSSILVVSQLTFLPRFLYFIPLYIAARCAYYHSSAMDGIGYHRASRLSAVQISKV